MANFKQALNDEKPALIFLLKLLILLCLVKTLFFLYNFNLYQGWQIENACQVFKIIAWSLYYDAVTLSIVSLPILLACYAKPISKILIWISIVLLVTMLLLNVADIFYYPFHRQRADADLLYVLRNPFHYGKSNAFLIIGMLILFIFFTGRYLYRISKKIVLTDRQPVKYPFPLVIITILVASLFFNKARRFVPAAPLISVSAEQLPLTQNSLHTFLYSLYRSNESSLPAHSFMNNSDAAQYFSIHKRTVNVASAPKNIVLFIMESVPFEFFDTASLAKPALPFLDSLVQHSTFYNNAFSYSYTSNKGITAILSGIPTIIDIPLFHSGYTNIEKTSIGKSLKAKGYTSSFYIGDNYDDFGFAKCANWLGFDHYNSMEKVKGYKDLEKHTMGLHDEYMLDLMQQQLQTTVTPFFNCFYNISTHFPNDLPAGFKQQTDHLTLPPAYKSMLYYDQCLQNFFAKIKNRQWYSNTVFIFCSDHWASPNRSFNEDKVNSFRIPLFIFDPSVNKKEMISNTVSQFDIMNTVLAYAGIKDSITSYGNSLTDATAFSNRTVFTKRNDAVYQAINNDYVLGLNAGNGNVLYCYNYRTDKERKQNLWPSKNPAIDSLAMQMKAFLQTATLHYQNKNVSTR